MIHFIKGTLAGTFENGIVIENGGIGFEVNIPSSSAVYMMPEGAEVTVYTAMTVREDDISLYGFDDRESLKMFRMLTGVSGIGSKGALSVLSSLTVTEIKKAVVFEDAALLSKAQGIGKKTAQRIVLELRDKIDAESIAERLDTPKLSSSASEAAEALISLGYSKTEAAEAVAQSGLEDASAEDYIKAALKILSRF
jgi:Holliday junction DNA helicase RuvA